MHLKKIITLTILLSNSAIAQYSWDGGSQPIEPKIENYKNTLYYYIDLTQWRMDMSIWGSTPKATVKSTGFHRDLSKYEYECLALNVYHEARGESIKGQEAIVYTTLNRSASLNYNYGSSKHICDILKSSFAFSWLNNGFKGAKNIKVYNKSLELVKRVVNTYHKDNSPVGDATHYVNIKTATTKHKWWKSPSMKKTAIVGNHTFYKYRDERVAMQ